MALSLADIATISRLLDAALALEPADREAWLAALPAEHQRHAEALRDMLAQAAKLDTDRPLEAPPKLPRADEAVAHAGDRVGAYRLLREIGRGGMGSVWLAERADGAYRRQVALKLPRLAWGAGLAERMAREREIGMLLEHPAIARLYDAGVDERGRPFLALEYVDGQPIDAWCDAQGLSVRDRLRLFVQVVKAVAYAHGRLVVHRDLKPSNVLVTPDGQAHLLDFGIAKLLLDAAPSNAGLTQEQGRVMTPHYASPEQVAGEAITVQSDVYSLGVLLYELLTGVLPIDPKRGTLGAMEDAILLGDAPLASSRVKDRVSARVLRGDGDAILAKAMQREPWRRYATADALALDVERHLNGETVTARPDSVFYRLRKAVRRHWAGATAVAVATVSIALGGGTALLHAHRATSAAEREQVVKDFVADVLRSALTAPRATTSAVNDVQRSAEDGVRLIRARFAGRPEMQAELFGMVGSVYTSMGADAYAAEYLHQRVSYLRTSGAEVAVQSVAERLLALNLLRLGKTEAAEVHASNAVQLARGSDALAADALAALARVQLQGRPTEVGSTLDRLEATLAGLPQESLARAWLLAGRGLWHQRENRLSKAPALLSQGVEMAKRVDGQLSQDAIDILLELGTVHWARGRLDEARDSVEAALAAMERRGGPDLVRAAHARAMSAYVMFGSRAYTYADMVGLIESSQQALAASPLPVPPLLRAEVDFQRGRVELQLGNIQAARHWFERSQQAGLNDANESPGSHFWTAVAQAWLAREEGRHEEAEALLVEQHRYRLIKGHETHPYRATDFASMAANLVMAGRLDQAAQVVASSPEFGAVDGADRAQQPALMLRAAHARVLFERGDIDGARLVWDSLPADEVSFDGIADWQFLKGQLLCATPGQQGAGLPMVDALVRKEEVQRYPNAPDLAWGRAVVGLCALANGDRAAAQAYAAQARAAFTAQPGVSPYYKAPLFKLERALGLKLPPV